METQFIFCVLSAAVLIGTHVADGAIQNAEGMKEINSNVEEEMLDGARSEHVVNRRSSEGRSGGRRQREIDPFPGTFPEPDPLSRSIHSPQVESEGDNGGFRPNVPRPGGPYVGSGRPGTIPRSGGGGGSHGGGGGGGGSHGGGVGGGGGGGGGSRHAGSGTTCQCTCH